MFTAFHVARGLVALTIGLDQLGRWSRLHVRHRN
jgi:hypothetical protein